jgi:hypothetical protein
MEARMRPLAFNRDISNRLQTRIQFALGALPLGLMFLAFISLSLFMVWLARAWGIPAHAPVKEQPNGPLWILIFIVTMAPCMIGGYLIGWVGNALICRYILGWKPAEIKATYLHSNVPNRWLKVEPILGEKDGPYRIKIMINLIVGWVGIILFGLLALYSIYREQYYAALPFLCFIALGVYVIFAGGTYVFDQDGVTHECGFGIFRMRWRDVRRIEQNYGATALIGEHSRFVLPPPSQWSGPEKAYASSLLTMKIRGSGITPVWSSSVNLKWHRNVRLRQPLSEPPAKD